MSLAKVAIVGRPNVGKSSIMNWLAKKRISVVDPMAGVTRDRVTYLLHAGDRYFELIDTGGIGIVDVDDLSEEIDHQIDIGLNEADILLFVVEGSAGITALDQEVARRLRRIDKPKILVVNKCDSPKLDREIAEFHSLIDADTPIVTTSVKGNRNQDDLIDAILEELPPPEPDEHEFGEDQTADPELKLAIVGRRNVGKSTFINQLAETERMIVSEIAGTTRDSVDIRFELDDKAFIAIDTPGVRKRKSLANSVEWYGLARAKRSIRRASVVFMFFDATQPISRVDKQLVREITEEHKPCIFVVNKWDLVQDKSTDDWIEYILKTFSDKRHVPVAFITAKTGRNIKKLINLAQSVFKQARTRIPTGELNRVVRAAVAKWAPPNRQNRNPRVKFAVQVGVEPPTIVLKVNDAKLFDPSWKRYFAGYLREALPFPEVPLKIYYRSKDDEKPGGKRDDDEQEWLMSDAELDAAVAAEDELADEEFEDDSVD
ncbi:MAG: ribosome biogenesis GTPase Der [Planctomycetaceae bacterium]|nr:ribosome biogenesis GTPase Der [Planctomycetaceae bacterium]